MRESTTGHGGHASTLARAGALCLVAALSVVLPAERDNTSALAGGYVAFANRTVCTGDPGIDIVASITGHGSTFEGAIHANGTLLVSGSDNTFYGDLTYNCAGLVLGTNNQFPPGSPHWSEVQPWPVPTPTFDCTDELSSPDSIDLNSSPTYWKNDDPSTNETKPGVICSGGDITLTGAGVIARNSFVTQGQGRIHISGNDFQLIAFQNEIVAYSPSSTDPAVKLSGSGGTWRGILWAPNGWVDVAGSSYVTVCGSLLGDRVSLPGSNGSFSAVGPFCDTTPPETTILSGPAALSNSASASFTFSSSEAGSSFQCSLDAAAFSACSTPATFSLLLDGPHAFQVRAVDAAGNVDFSPDSSTWTIDTLAPAAPSTPDLEAASDSGISNADKVTNDSTPLLNGSAEPGSTVSILDGVTLLGTATAGGAGGWSFTSGLLSDGVHSIAVRATDAAGNISPPSAALSLTIDTLSPAPPSTPDLAAASDSGVSNADNLTNDATPTIGGSTEPASTVQAFDGLSPTGSAVAAGGVWSITTASLSEGSHSITAQALDVAGNLSPLSGALSLTIDTLAPATPSTPDLDGASDSGASDGDDVTNDSTPQLTGTSEPDSAVSLFDAANPLGTTSASGAGAWSFTSGVLANGVHSVTAAATDAAGNGSPASPTLSFTIDTLAPAPPSAPDLVAASDSGASNADDVTNDSTPTVGGSAEAASNVTAYDVLDSVGSTVASGAGAWSITSSLLAEGPHAITARAIDVAGNPSPLSEPLSLTVDTLAPDTAILSGPPSLTSSTSATFGLSSSQAGASIECELDSGGFSGCVSGQSYSGLAVAAHTFRARSTDPAGNTDPTPGSHSWTITDAISLASSATAVVPSGGTISYSITLVNTSSVNVSNVTIVLPAPPSSIPAGCSLGSNANTLVCTIPAGGSLTIALTMQAPIVSSTVTLTSCADAAAAIPQSTCEDTTVQPSDSGGDGDGDGVSDASDNCPDWANPTQALPGWSVPADDADCDGFNTTVESYVGTNAQAHCPTTLTPNDEAVDAWPPDFNDDMQVTLQDVLLLKTHLNTAPPDPSYSQRFDFSGDGQITLQDVLIMKPFFGLICT